MGRERQLCFFGVEQGRRDRVFGERYLSPEQIGMPRRLWPFGFLEPAIAPPSVAWVCRLSVPFARSASPRYANSYRSGNLWICSMIERYSSRKSAALDSN